MENSAKTAAIFLCCFFDAGKNAFQHTKKGLKSTTLLPFLQVWRQIAQNSQQRVMQNIRQNPKTIYLQEILDKTS
ncbi:MAG: hypothetical protein R2912_08425 [Eubacteriales bacterium]